MKDNNFIKKSFVTVVIPTYNRKDSLIDCINSLIDQTYPKEAYEIIVVDDGSTDGTAELFKRNFTGVIYPRLRYIYQINRGSYAARNNGIKNALGDIICFTDDDCVVDKNWVKNIVSGFSGDKIAGVGGEIQSFKPETLAQKYCQRYNPIDVGELKKIFFPTANVAYLKSVLQEIDGFDDYFRESGDVDIGLRVRLKEYSLNYISSAIVYHKHRRSIYNLVKSSYIYAIGYAELHKKYPKNFNFFTRFINILYLLIRKTIFIPIKISKDMIFYDDKILAFTSPLIDCARYISSLLGLIIGTFFRQNYSGHKIYTKLEFLNELKGIKWGN
ncbi:MAG: glycosyltransferase [Candidatus Methanoperedens sp.]|nr:glycosyltransferase [Candidatus Methanoperedens sp.]